MAVTEGSVATPPSPSTTEEEKSHCACAQNVHVSQCVLSYRLGHARLRGGVGVKEAGPGGRPRRRREMAGQQFQYDDSGNTFFYFLTSFVGLIVIPATYYLWPRNQNAGKAWWFCSPSVWLGQHSLLWGGGIK